MSRTPSIKTCASVELPIESCFEYLEKTLNMSVNEIEIYNELHHEEVELLSEIIALEIAYLVLFHTYGISQHNAEHMNTLRNQKIKAYDKISETPYVRHESFKF